MAPLRLKLDELERRSYAIERLAAAAPQPDTLPPEALDSETVVVSLPPPPAVPSDLAAQVASPGFAELAGRRSRSKIAVVGLVLVICLGSLFGVAVSWH